MDESLAKALRKRDELRAALAKVEQFIALHAEIFGTNEELEALTAELVARPSRESQEAMFRAALQKIRPGISVSALVGAAERVLRDAGHPMTRGELVAALETRGVPMSTNDPSRYVGTILWRHQEKFENIEGRGYWLKGEPLPEKQTAATE